MSSSASLEEHKIKLEQAFEQNKTPTERQIFLTRGIWRIMKRPSADFLIEKPSSLSFEIFEFESAYSN